ncbi:MAG: hypothetical protein H7Y42_18010 [Chitinophagaceae bacterium]|nr:hypothetical protein [Chitinophagaceae bacterium]
MRKFTAILIALAFIATQYARQVVFLECTLQNYFLATEMQCDCETALVASSPMPQDALPVAHPHTHIDENYFIPNIIVLTNETLTVDRMFSIKSSLPPEPKFQNLDRPPCL